MTNDKRKFASISCTITHGTAKRVEIRSVIPSNKSDKELFWTKILCEKLAEKYEIAKVESNPDDSHGKHDTIITLKDDSLIGVQVTEFTYELARTRKHIKESYLKQIHDLIQSKNIKSNDKLVFNIFFPYSESKKPTSDKPKKIVEAIEELISNGISNRTYQYSFGTISVQTITKDEFFIRNVNNIGVNVNFDNLPRTLEMYSDCVDSIVLKKSKSLSNWLLIWSLEFWKDRHWLGNELIDYMESQFKDSKFDKVFFVESIDGDGPFQVNLKLYEIK